MDVVLQVVALRKRFGSTLALDGASLTVPDRAIVGLLGPNGAGKTTLMKIIAGLVYADDGTVSLSTRDAAGSTRIGAFIDRPGFLPYLSARLNLLTLGLTSGLRRPVLDSQVEGLLERLELSANADRKVGGFSTGMKQRLGVAAALLGSPDLLILDEPASGLDPAGVFQMRGLLADIRRDGCSIFVSSHLLGEVEQVCDTVVVLNRGRVVATGPIEELATDQPAWRLKYGDPMTAERASAALTTHFRTVVAGVVVSAIALEGSDLAPLDVVAPLGLLPREVAFARATLEEVYLRLTSAPESTT
jgi:ABC-2 type transport system ATP-binding protein